MALPPPPNPHPQPVNVGATRWVAPRFLNEGQMMDATDIKPGDPITGWKPVPLSPLRRRRPEVLPVTLPELGDFQPVFLGALLLHAKTGQDRPQTG